MIYTLKLKPDPNDYSIDYYDGSSGLTEAVMTVEGNNVFNSDASKDGYILKGWDTDPAGKTVVYEPGAPVPDDFLTRIEDPAPEDRYKLYAVWEAVPVEPPAVEEEEDMDESPAAGDDIPAGMLIMLAVALLAGAAGVCAYQRRVD